MMKIRMFLSIAALMLAATIYAQTDQLPKDTIDGTVVYKYTVQKSEGLYRISKNFEVSQEELIRFNPQLQTEGLKYGQTIYVPVKGAPKVEQPKAEKATAAEAASTAAEENAPAYIKHVIQPKETLYSLSRRYRVPVATLEATNPELSKNLPIGATLLIPTGKDASAAAAAEAAHAANAANTASKAAEEPAAAVAQPAATDAVADATATGAEATGAEATGAEAAAAADTTTVSADADTTVEVFRSAVPLRIAYLLPLQADAAKRDATMDRFVDFYEGALLAIYEAQQNGQQFDIYTYDIQKGDVGIQQVLQKGEMRNMDAIIGPAYPSQVSYAAMFAKQHRIPCFVPFTNKVSGLEHNPYLMQFNPGDQLEAEAAARLMEADKEKTQLIFVDPQSTDVPAFVNTFRRRTTDAGFNIADVTMREILNDSLRYKLASDKKNILVFNAEKYSAVSVVMNKVINQKGGCELALFGRYSWKNEKSPIPMVYVSIFHDAEEAELAAYEALYNRYFGHKLSSTSPRYDLLGYDLTRSTIAYLLRSQQAASDAAKDDVYSEEYKGLQSDIRYARIGEDGGCANTDIKLITK